MTHTVPMLSLQLGSSGQYMPYLSTCTGTAYVTVKILLSSPIDGSRKGASCAVVQNKGKSMTMGYHPMQGDISFHSANDDDPLHQHSENTLS
jgi:hypothetical protein